jgi:hypothetical protein
MTTIFTHPAVAQYLADLDEALLSGPSHHAADLRAQVREHLEDALGPDSTDAEIEATLARLGPPTELIADSASTAEHPVRVVTVHPSLAQWLKRRSGRWWIAFGVAMIVVAASGVAWKVETSVRPLRLDCEICFWYSPIDDANNKFVRPFDSNIPSDLQQWTVPLRVHKPQEFLYTVWNPSSVSQRLIGGAFDAGVTSEHMSLSFSTASPMGSYDGNRGLTYRTSVWIPPHGSRMVRQSWTRDCSNEVGSTESIDAVTLRVRALGITRHETLRLPALFATVAGRVPKADRCR